MIRASASKTVLAGLALALTLSAQRASAQPAGATTTIERRVQAAEPPGLAELSHVVLDFAPGTWTPLHSHGGGSYNTVLEGEITLRIGRVDQTFKAGEGWVDRPCTLHMAGNSGAAPARLIASFVVPKGVPPSTIFEPTRRSAVPPEPTPLAHFKTQVASLPQPMDVIHRTVEIEPGAPVPIQAPAGLSIVSVLAGGVSLDVGGSARSVAAGNSWVEPADSVRTFTASGSPARVATTTFAPRDASLGGPR